MVKYYIIQKNMLYIKDNTLASLVESGDLSYDDYFTA